MHREDRKGRAEMRGSDLAEHRPPAHDHHDRENASRPQRRSRMRRRRPRSFASRRSCAQQPSHVTTFHVARCSCHIIVCTTVRATVNRFSCRMRAHPVTSAGQSHGSTIPSLRSAALVGWHKRVETAVVFYLPPGSRRDHKRLVLPRAENHNGAGLKVLRLGLPDGRTKGVAAVSATDQRVAEADADCRSELTALLDRQRKSFLADGPPDVAIRRDRIDRLLALVLDNTDELIEAMNTDFGTRPRAASLFAEILGMISSIEHVRANTPKWMRAPN